MNVLFISDSSSWINKYIKSYFDSLESDKYKFNWTHDHRDIKGTWDLCFILSYTRIIEPEYLKYSKHNLIVHESNLPQGKGMSPLTWQVIEGKQEIPIVLFEAEKSIDSGKIYFRDKITLTGIELVDDLRELQAEKTFQLIDQFLYNYPNISGEEQAGDSSYYPRRTSKDSQLDLNKTLAEQINLLRVCDNEKYPAFFVHNGQKFLLKISKSYD